MSAWFMSSRRSDAGPVLALVLTLGLAGCSPSLDELQAWADQQRRSVKFGMQALPAPTRFEPQPYQTERGADPFDAHKLTDALRVESAQSNPRLVAELRRRREPLEAYAVESMSMAGTLLRQGRTVALVSVDKMLYQVKLGDYLGQNNGRVVKIEEGRIELLEVVQDASGEWVERTTSVLAQEGIR